MAVKLIRTIQEATGLIREYQGLSTDVKPTLRVASGSKFYEVDTGDNYVFSPENINPVLAPTGWWIELEYFDTSTGTAVEADILDGKIAFVNNDEIVGSMPDNSADDVEIIDLDGTLIPLGYSDGTNSAVLATAQANRVIPGNLKHGITLLGVEGAYYGDILLQSISITTPATKLDYIEGELFDDTDMVVVATYSNGATKTITEYTVSPAIALEAADVEVVVSYTEVGVTVTDTQAITVGTLNSISVTTPPTKTVYVAGEIFDPAGMVVTASYTNGINAEVAGYTFAPAIALVVEDVAVTISYIEGLITETDTQAITVNPA